jgi:signal transduction histidine kinase
LSQANAIKDKFFAIVAHDLRGPIGGLASLFNEAVTSADDLTDELLGIVRATTLSTKHFLEELLTWARSQRGEIDCRPVAFDMRAMLKETGELYSAQAQAKDVRLSVDGAEGCWVCADLAMTHTVLRNLMHNALKFTAGGGSIRASVKRDAGRCMVSIGDSGVGMSRETLESIFRLDVKPQSSPGTRDEQGTGLGLILCKEFVEKNGGAIGAERTGKVRPSGSPCPTPGNRKSSIRRRCWKKPGRCGSCSRKTTSCIGMPAPACCGTGAVPWRSRPTATKRSGWRPRTTST